HCGCSVGRVYRPLPGRLCLRLLGSDDNLAHQGTRQSLLRQRNSTNLHARDEHTTDNDNRPNTPITDPVPSNSPTHSPVHPLHFHTSTNTCHIRHNWEVSFLRCPLGSRQLVLH